jgi:hypothetical protein
MRSTYLFKGFIRAEEPLATASEALKTMSKQSAVSPIPFVGTRSTVRGFEGLAGGDAPEMYFPGTSLRGALRRVSVAIIREAYVNRFGKNFSLDEHFMNTVGGIKGAGKMDKISPKDVDQWRDRNPLISVYGAGDAGYLGFVHGRLRMSNAWCEKTLQPVHLGHGVRNPDREMPGNEVGYMTDREIETMLARKTAASQSVKLRKEVDNLKMEIRKAKRTGGAVEDLEAQLQQAEADLNASNSDAGTTVSPMTLIAGFLAIPAGAKMDHSMSLVRATDVELGLILKTLNRFALTYPSVGAYARLGCGLIAGEWAVDVASESGRLPVGKVRFSPYEPLEVEGESLTSAMAAWDAFIASGEFNFGVPARESPAVKTKASAKSGATAS